MEETPVSRPESSDRVEITLIIAVGVIVIVCICCLLGIAGYALYKDLPSTIFPDKSAVEAKAETPTPGMTGEKFSDSFNSNRNDWTEGFFEDEYGTIDYKIDGVYTWDVVAKQGVNQKSWASSAPLVDDFLASADMLHISGAENASYGLLFRVVDTDNLYYFSISDVGYYYVGLLESGVWTTLIDWTETTFINVKSSNTLKVTATGDEFVFFINSAEVERLQDSTHPSGTAGLAIELYDSGDVSTFEFDNFIIETP